LKSKRVIFPCGDLRLEGELHLPEGKGHFPVVIVCHPHPLYGGDMDNNVVMAVYFALVKSSIAALRFNFRGTGNSSGSYGEGVGEQDDLQAALDFLSTLKEIDRQRIGLAGYSFGGMVAAYVAIKDNRVKQLALISPALNETGWVQLKKYASPKLILTGDADTSVPFQPFQRFFGDAEQYQVIAGADHFWSGFEEQLSGKIARFFHDQNV
jgi:Predicted hydrolase of the alpha/beta superfamily